MLTKNAKEDFPNLQIIKKIKLKDPSELYEEALKVKTILSETPVIPEKEGLVFHIVDIEWFKTWKAYTGYAKIKVQANEFEGETPNGETPSGDDQSTTI